jgi:hypothetical protein
VWFNRRPAHKDDDDALDSWGGWKSQGRGQGKGGQGSWNKDKEDKDWKEFEAWKKNQKKQAGESEEDKDTIDLERLLVQILALERVSKELRASGTKEEASAVDKQAHAKREERKALKPPEEKLEIIKVQCSRAAKQVADSKERYATKKEELVKAQEGLAEIFATLQAREAKEAGLQIELKRANAKLETAAGPEVGFSFDMGADDIPEELKEAGRSTEFKQLAIILQARRKREVAESAEKALAGKFAED